jgi:integration host factor subunit alpha
MKAVNDTTITRADLADALYEDVGLSRAESADFVDTIFEEISLALEEGENVKISSFGSFNLREKSARIGRNPKTGVEAVISARNVVVFKPSHKMKEEINGKQG